MSRTTLSSTLLILLLAAPGCQEDSTSLAPLDAETATFQLNTHLRTHAEGFARAVIFLDQSDLAVGAAEFTGLGASEGEVICDANGCVEPAPTYSYDARDDASALADVFEQRVFVAENIEAESDTTITFLMRPEVVCADPDTSEIDPDCADLLGDVEIRLIATTLGDDDIDIAVTLDDLAPVDFEIYGSHIAADIDLAASRAALQRVLDATAEPDTEQPILPDVSGALRAELLRDSEHAYTTRLHVTRDIRVSGVGSELPLDLTIQESRPLLSATFDSEGEIVEAALQSGAIHLGLEGALFGGEEICSSGPNGEMSCTSEPGLEGTLAIDVAGLSGAMTMSAAADEVRVDGIGLGDAPATASIDGDTLVSATLSTFDLIARDADGATTLDISPMMQLELMLAFTHIEAQLDEGAPGWLLDETFSLTIDGEAPSLSLLDNLFGEETTTPAPCVPGEVCEEPTPTEPTPEALIQVLSGQLEIAAANATRGPVTVTAGQCLIGDESAEGEHLLDMMSAGDCP